MYIHSLSKKVSCTILETNPPIIPRGKHCLITNICTHIVHRHMNHTHTLKHTDTLHLHVHVCQYVWQKRDGHERVPSITLRELDTEYLVSEGRGKRQRDGIHFPNPINKFDG